MSCTSGVGKDEAGLSPVGAHVCTLYYLVHMGLTS